MNLEQLMLSAQINAEVFRCIKEDASNKIYRRSKFRSDAEYMLKGAYKSDFDGIDMPQELLHKAKLVIDGEKLAKSILKMEHASMTNQEILVNYFTLCEEFERSLHSILLHFYYKNKGMPFNSKRL